MLVNANAMPARLLTIPTEILLEREDKILYLYLFEIRRAISPDVSGENFILKNKYDRNEAAMTKRHNTSCH